MPKQTTESFIEQRNKDVAAAKAARSKPVVMPKITPKTGKK